MPRPIPVLASEGVTWGGFPVGQRRHGGIDRWAHGDNFVQTVRGWRDRQADDAQPHGRVRCLDEKVTFTQQRGFCA